MKFLKRLFQRQKPVPKPQADPADDGPEVYLIRFFNRFEDGLFWTYANRTPVQNFRIARGL